MTVKQISVFIENSQGSLAPICKLLGEHRIDLIALSIADTTNFGILRAIVNDTEKAYKIIVDAGYTANLTEVLAVAVPDQPGGLAQVLETLSQTGVTVEYLYSFVRQVGKNAVIIFRVDDVAKTQAALEATHARVLSQQEIRDF